MFGRHPEGLWLPETAVDLETLEILAENNIRYTILAPRPGMKKAKPATDSKDSKDVKEAREARPVEGTSGDVRSE